MTDIAVDPIDGTTLDRPGPRRRPGGDRRRPSGAPCSTPGPASTWRSWPSGPGPRAPCDITQHARPRTCTRSAEALGRPVRDLTAVILDRPRHDDLIAEVRGDRGPDPADHRRRRGRRHRHRLARRRHRHPLRHRRHARGRAGRRRPQVHGRRDPGPALPAQRGGARRRPRRRLRPRRRAHDRRPGAGQQLLLRRHRHHRRRAAPGRPVPRVRRHDPVARDAVQVGHAAQDRRQPPPGTSWPSSAPSRSAERPPRRAPSAPSFGRCSGGGLRGDGEAQLGPRQGALGLDQLDVHLDVLGGRRPGRRRAR